MKRMIFPCVLLLLGVATGLFAQNVQLHYDFGRMFYNADMPTRPHLTSTVEKFHPDRWGSTFFFVDMDYNSKGVEQAYWEVARELQFWQAPISIHLEYNGGLAKQYAINNAYLLGATYTYNNKEFSKGFSLSAMYKYIQKNDSPHNFQLTGTWYVNFCGDVCTFSGFADYWREQTWFGSKMTFMAEPQLWLNLNKVKGFSPDVPLSIGTEVEVSDNFYQKKTFVIPTVALKWTFN